MICAMIGVSVVVATGSRQPEMEFPMTPQTQRTTVNRSNVPYPKEDAIPFKIEGTYCRLVPLGNRFYAIVNADDYEWAMQWKWRAAWDRTRNRYYVMRGNGHKDSSGYRGRFFLHRELLGLPRGDKRQGDHENLNTFDNRRRNLRIATPSQNSMNRRMRKDNKTGFKGVTFHKRLKKYQSNIRINGILVHLGYFDRPEPAHAAYCEKALQYQGEFARLK